MESESQIRTVVSEYMSWHPRPSDPILTTPPSPERRSNSSALNTLFLNVWLCKKNKKNAHHNAYLIDTFFATALT